MIDASDLFAGGDLSKFKLGLDLFQRLTLRLRKIQIHWHNLTMYVGRLAPVERNMGLIRVIAHLKQRSILHIENQYLQLVKSVIALCQFSCVWRVEMQPLSFSADHLLGDE